MSDQLPHLHADDARLHRVLEALEGKSVSGRWQQLAEHPEFANALDALLAAHERIRSLPEPSTMGHESSTLDARPRDTQKVTLRATAGDYEEPTMRKYAPGHRFPDATKRGSFGDYELLGELARGGMGVVYAARQVKLNRIVALKMILDGQLAGEQEIERFQAEAEAAAQLDHPGIVPIYEVGEHHGQHYFSMAFVDGGSLADKIKDGPIPPRQAAEYIKKVADAVAYAHMKGVTHRDLKPANVLLDSNGTPKVTDFGLAKRVEGDSGMTATGQILGTPSYMPPEQAAGHNDQVKETADIYSLSAVLYTMLTGRPPFLAATPIETIMQIFERDPLPPRQFNSSIPGDLETICMKGMRKEVHARYVSATEFAEDIQRWLDRRPIQARRVGSLEKCAKWCHLNPFPTAALAAMPYIMNRRFGMALFVASLSMGLYVPLSKLFKVRIVLAALFGCVVVSLLELLARGDLFWAIDVGLSGLLVFVVGILVGAYGRNLIAGLATIVGHSVDLTQLFVILSLVSIHFVWLVDGGLSAVTDRSGLFPQAFFELHGPLGKQRTFLSWIDFSFVFVLPLVPFVTLRPNIPQIRGFAKANKLHACVVSLLVLMVLFVAVVAATV